MARVSIISLTYQSATLADWVYDSVHKFTPMISRGEAEFFFVANDPTPQLLSYLDKRGYSFVLNRNKPYTDEQLFALGYATPGYMSGVYRGYNQGILRAESDFVVLVNSDNYFSPDWLENLLKYSDRTKVISSTLVERRHPKFGVFPGAVNGEFGGTVAEFNEAAFLTFVSTTSKTGLRPGGAYMPTLFHRDIAIEAGLYPTGNVAADDFESVARYGDEAFFDRLESLGVRHLTALDSIVYHLKEGEREDAPPVAADGEPVLAADTELTEATPYPITLTIKPVYDPLYPTPRHEALMSGLLGEPLGVGPASERHWKETVAGGLRRVGLLKPALWVWRRIRAVRRVFSRAS